MRLGLVVAKLVSLLHISLMIIFRCLLMGVFFLKSATEVLLELLFLGDVALMWLQVRQGLVQLRHKDLIISLAKVSVIVSAELIVAVDHVSNSAHHPLDRIHRAHSVRITVHNSDWCLTDVLDRDISRSAVLFALQVRLSVFLEAALDTVLEVVGQ